jgi:hypothetical protein
MKGGGSKDLIKLRADAKALLETSQPVHWLELVENFSGIHSNRAASPGQSIISDPMPAFERLPGGAQHRFGHNELNSKMLGVRLKARGDVHGIP